MFVSCVSIATTLRHAGQTRRCSIIEPHAPDAALKRVLALLEVLRQLCDDLAVVVRRDEHGLVRLAQAGEVRDERAEWADVACQARQ